MNTIFKRTEYVWLSAIIFFSIALKLFIFLRFFHDLSQITQPDSLTYLDIARGILTYGHFVDSAKGYIFFRTPGYPTFIALIYYLLSAKPSAIVVTQIILTCIPIVCVFHIVKTLFNKTAAVIAALLVACNLLYFFYSYMILSDALFFVLISLVCLTGLNILTNKKYIFANAFFLGLLLAVATLCRPINYFLIIPILLGISMYAKAAKFSLKKSVTILFLILLPNILLVGGWQVRNKVLFHSFRFSDISRVDGVRTYFPETYQLFLKDKDHDYLTQKPGMATDVKILLRHPAATAKQIIAGVASLLRTNDSSLLHFLKEQNGVSLVGNLKKEIETFQFNKALHDFRQGFAVINSLLFLFYDIVIYSLILLAFIAILKKIPQPNPFVHLFLWGIFFYFLLLSANNAGGGRFRLPLEIIFSIYASFGASILLKILQFRKRVFTSTARSIPRV